MTRRTATVLAALVVFGTLAALFGMYDLEISREVVDPDSAWARFVEEWSGVPGMLVILTALYVLSARLATRGGGRGDAAARVGLVALAVGALLYVAHVVVTGLGGPAPFAAEPLPVLAAALAVGGLGHWWVGRQAWRPSVRALAFARAAFWLAVIDVTLFVHVVKPLWGRVRFRDLAPDFADFTAWYVPQGVTGHSSFPSGHTALGWMLLAIIPLATGRGVGARVALAAVAVGWGLFVAAGRVRIGAHYPSDVLFSTAVAWVTFVVATRRDLEVGR